MIAKVPKNPNSEAQNKCLSPLPIRLYIMVKIMPLKILKSCVMKRFKYFYNITII